MFWIGRLRGPCSELGRWAVSAIFENYLLWFNRIFLLFDERRSCVLQIFLLRSIKAYLCPNINFDSVDFSERRPEEVISFFWRSVYINLISRKLKHFIPHSWGHSNSITKDECFNLYAVLVLKHLQSKCTSWVIASSIVMLSDGPHICKTKGYSVFKLKNRLVYNYCLQWCKWK